MTDHLVWHQAAAIAAKEHRHQVRKDGETPYSAHTTRVALVVATLFQCEDPDVIAAALLHDVIEDCDVDYDNVLEDTNETVADIVATLSKDKRMIESEREKAFDAQVAAGSWQAKLVKLADIYDNMGDARDPGAKRKFIDKAEWALAMTEADPRLDRARQVLADGLAAARRSLGMETG